jgi:glutamyl/glutaminyl-tRNA synthetase
LSIASLSDKIQFNKMIKTRFAPSPTGSLHIGGLRTAVYAYTLAKHSGGKFILRIEDTDKKREVKGAIEEIKKLLTLFNLQWDEYFVQSERLDIYKKAADKLVKDGYAYKDSDAIRLKIPKNEKISYHDFVLDKQITWETNSLEELVLLKSDGFPTYHLAVVVDDNDMGITHVLRGHDWLPSTPIHLLVYKLCFDLPKLYCLYLGPRSGKLSKKRFNFC